MVHLSKLLILPLATFTTARSFCGAKTNAQILFQASKFAAEDAAEFSNQLDAAGTNFNDPSVAIRGGTASGLLKYINWIVPNSRWITIKTYVHVLASSTKYEDGYVSDKAILDQLVVLNKDYAPHNILFIPLGIDRTINAEWANQSNIEYSPSYVASRRALRKGDYTTLNIYIQQRLPYGSYGFAEFPLPPEQRAVGGFNFTIDGVTVAYFTLPGGRAPYNLGKTLTHEVGHWFYLLHTFQGGSCTGPGDFIADTPQESQPTGDVNGVPTGCPETKDTCPNQPGLDPIHNYMDYSDE